MMDYTRLFIFYEGGDDGRFIDKILSPLFESRYDHVDKIPYTQEKHEKIDKYLHSIHQMKGDLIFLSDINDKPCVTAKKSILTDKFKYLQNKDISIVIKEIESWYLAGLDDMDCPQIGIKLIKSTDTLSKEEFNKLIPPKSDSRISFMIEILKCFKISIAKQKNKSFRYFAEKYNLKD
ncbi:MAG: hypothetical protein NT106_09450 [Candidatus Sumerlaeota bacterium]|nr:hypothetical protein [Candidatus Sumerlaeota bacterium]